MRPTPNYHTFSLAQRFGMTARQLLTGQQAALTNMEHYLWARYDTATARFEQQARRGR